VRSVFLVTLIPRAFSHALYSACALVSAAVFGGPAGFPFGVDILMTRDIRLAPTGCTDKLYQFPGLKSCSTVRSHGGVKNRGAPATAGPAITFWLPGFSRLSPAEGAFYLFADIGDWSNDSAAFCARMLREAGVAVSPGLDFDRTRGDRFVRFSYRRPEDDMRAAAERLSRWR
jgi:hypothetical protein